MFTDLEVITLFLDQQHGVAAIVVAQGKQFTLFGGLRLDGFPWF